MRGKINEQEEMFVCVRLEEIVPQNHLLREIKKQIDFSCIDRLTTDLYSKKGRPSIDPQVLIGMMLIGYLYGITSERRLCEEVQVNIAYRWFCGLKLEDKVPDHSTFTKNRNGRFAQGDLFRKLFHEIVKQAQEKELIKGKCWSSDATTIEANASMKSLEPIEVPFNEEEYLHALDGANGNEEETKEVVSKERISKNDIERSRTDPEARLTGRRGSKKHLGYSDNILVDSEHNIILDVEVTMPSQTQEGLASVEMVKRSEFKLGMVPESFGADSAYGRGVVVRGLKEAGVNAYIPRPTPPPKRGEGVIFSRESFIYDSENDYLICPAGHILKRSNEKRPSEYVKYKASKQSCKNCVLKEQCTTSKTRTVALNKNQEALDWAEFLRGTYLYNKVQYMRKKIERLFGEAKEQMGLRRAKMRGKEKVTEQCLLTAMAQNIKRIIKALKDPKTFQALLLTPLQGLYTAFTNHFISIKLFLFTQLTFLRNHCSLQELFSH